MASDKMDAATRARLDKLGQCIPTPGMVPNWEHDDLFWIDCNQEVNIKKALAMMFKCQYDTVGTEAPVYHIAHDVDQVPAYDPDKIKEEHKQYNDIGKNAKSEEKLKAVVTSRAT